LKPEEGTNTYGRKNFMLHGGEKPGSAGCIDVGKNDKVIFSELLKSKNEVKVKVEP
jgi:hypothetical protein